MPDVTLGMDVKDERTIRVPVPTDENTTGQMGKFLVNAAQEGYTLKEASLIQEHKGTQRDPYTVTKGVVLKVAR